MMKPYEQRFPWNLDWNLLRTFMVVVEQGGVTRAADFLGLKQPTISSALKRLEEVTGHKLIVRKPNQFNVTRAGRVLYNECSAIFGTVTQLPALMDRGEEELRGHISIVLASHVISPHFDEVLHRFADQHDKVTFSLTIADSPEIVGLIGQNRSSFGVCLLNRLPENLETRVLYREFFALYCGPRHRLFHQSEIPLSELEGERSVSFQTEVQGGPLEPVSRLRSKAKLASGWRGVSSNLPELRRMIVTNIGIGALPVHVAERDVNLGNLRQLPPYDDLPPVDIHLLTNPRRKMSEAESALLRAFERMIAETPLGERTYLRHPPSLQAAAAPGA